MGNNVSDKYFAFGTSASRNGSLILSWPFRMNPCPNRIRDRAWAVCQKVKLAPMMAPSQGCFVVLDHATCKDLSNHEARQVSVTPYQAGHDRRIAHTESHQAFHKTSLINNGKGVFELAHATCASHVNTIAGVCTKPLVKDSMFPAPS